MNRSRRLLQNPSRDWNFDPLVGDLLDVTGARLTERGHERRLPFAPEVDPVHLQLMAGCDPEARHLNVFRRRSQMARYGSISAAHGSNRVVAFQSQHTIVLRPLDRSWHASSDHYHCLRASDARYFECDAQGESTLRYFEWGVLTLKVVAPGVDKRDQICFSLAARNCVRQL